MSTLEEHEAEQARITAECEAGECDHPECHEEPDTTQVWLTYVDQTDGCDRESWSVFYTTPIVTLSQAAAEQAGRDEIAALCDDDPDVDPTEYTAHVVGPLEVHG